MRILFLGAGAFGLPTLRSLCLETRDHQIIGVVTQLDRPAGRGQALAPTPIAEWAQSAQPNLPLLKSTDINRPDEVGWIDGRQPDMLLVIAFGQKIGPAAIGARPAINLHASLLPRWRGAAPINAAIVAGDHETGNSIITVADRMDAGLVLAQSRRPIDPAQTAGELHDVLAQDGVQLVGSTLADIAAHGVRGQTQDESLVTKAKKMSKADGWIDFLQPARQLRDRVHGLLPWPGVTVLFRDKPLKLLRVESQQLDAQPAQTPPGTLIDPALGLVACGSHTALRLLLIQPAGGKPMPWRDFAVGHRPQPGDRFLGRT